MTISVVVFPFRLQPRVAQQRARRHSDQEIPELTLRGLETRSSRVYGGHQYGVVPAAPPSHRLADYQSFTATFWWLRDQMQAIGVVGVGELLGHAVHFLPTVSDQFHLVGEELDIFSPTLVDVLLEPQLVDMLTPPEESQGNDDPGDPIDSLEIDFGEFDQVYTPPPRSVFILPPRKAEPDVSDAPAQNERGTEGEGALFALTDMPPDSDLSADLTPTLHST